jgi:hypothetical protein
VFVSVVDPADRAVWEMVFEHYLGIREAEGDPGLDFEKYCAHFQHLERLGLGVDVSKADAVRAWAYSVPGGEGGRGLMSREQFVRAAHTIKCLAEGRSLPPPPLPLAPFRDLTPTTSPRIDFGTRDCPLPYNLFAALLRPLIVAECERKRVYRKSTPVLVLCRVGSDPFNACLADASPAARQAASRPLRLRNLSANLDGWSIDVDRFRDNYRDSGAAGWQVTSPCLAEATDGMPLREAIETALANSAETAGAEDILCGMSTASWTQLRPLLVTEANSASAIGEGEAMEWRLVLPRNHVVAVKLTHDVLASRMELLNLKYSPDQELFREETYCSSVSFRAGDYAVSDVAAAGPGGAGWVYKAMSTAKRGQRHITRTIGSSVFDSTYRAAADASSPDSAS